MTKALAQLDKLTAAISKTHRDLAILREGHEATARELRAAEQALRAYHAAVAAGERPEDEAEEDRLIAAKARIEGRIDSKAPRGKVRDIGIAVRETSLRKALELQQLRRAEWLTANRAAVLAERAEIAKAERARLTAAIAELRDSIRSWDATEREWHAIADALDLDLADVPPMPLRLTAQQLDMDIAGNAPHQLAPAPWWILDDVPDDAPAGRYGKRWIDDVAAARADRRDPQAARERERLARERALEHGEVVATGYNVVRRQ